jgi:streptomycin 6-kinase
MLDEYLDLWALEPDGSPIITHSSHLVPVRRRGIPAMLKIAALAEETRGGKLMAWWDGVGAARVLARAGDAILLERAEGSASLVDLARNGRDDEASRIISSVLARLHATRERPLPELVPLSHWFESLVQADPAHGGILATAAAAAQGLLAAPREVRVLHCDIHHGKILDFGARGWLAIDPKGLIGDRGFDYANLFCIPDHQTATSPGRLARQVEIVADAAQLERRRSLQWVLAWAGLSASWHLEDGTPPETAISVAEIADAELRK